MKELILASASPRRRALLKGLGLSFSVESSAVSETVTDTSNPGKLVEELARRKAAAVAAAQSALLPENKLVIGADTIVVLEGTILGKPQDEGEAHAMLSRLADRWHEVFTGVAVVEPSSGHVLSAHECTRVKFRALRDEEIRAYVATGEPMDKAGAYGVQGRGGLLVERIEGCFYNVVGLPLVKLASLLSVFGFDVWEGGKSGGGSLPLNHEGAAGGLSSAGTIGSVGG